MAEEDLLWTTVTQALAPVAHLEMEWDISKLEKRVREYFRKAGKALEYRSKPWQQLVNDYADSVFASVFQALNDRKWLSRVDFVWAVDAGIKEMFPKAVLRGVHPLDFERCVLGAHDRAFEDQWYLPILWEHVQALVLEGKAARKKVYDAMDHGRKAAARGSSEGAIDLKEFVARWVEASIARLSKACQGYPEAALEESVACPLFHALVEAETLPIALVAASGGQPPRNWPFVDYAVHQAYIALSNGGESTVAVDGAAIARGKTRVGNQGLPIWARGKAKAKPMAKVQCSAAETAALSQQSGASEGRAGEPSAVVGPDADDEDSWGTWPGAAANASVTDAEIHGDMLQLELESASHALGNAQEGDGECEKKDNQKMEEGEAREEKNEEETVQTAEDGQVEEKEESGGKEEIESKQTTEQHADPMIEDNDVQGENRQRSVTEAIANIGDPWLEEAAYSMCEPTLLPAAKKSRSDGTV